MKQKIIIAILLLCMCKVHGQSWTNSSTPSAVAEFSTLYAMQTYPGTFYLAHVKDTSRGGWFVGIISSTLVADSGVIIQGVGRQWIRQMQPSQALNLKWFGAKAIGIAGYKADSAAISQALLYVGRHKQGGSIYAPASDSPYCWAGYGYICPNNLNFYGDGIGKTNFLFINMNYQPTGAGSDYYPGAFLFFGTFSTDSAHNMSRVPRFEMYDGQKGDTWVKLRNASDVDSFVVGDIIKPSGWAYNKQQRAGKTIWRKNCFAQVVSISNDTLILDHALSMEIIKDDPTYAAYEVANDITSPADTGSAVVFRCNAKETMSRNLHVPDQMAYNVTVHDASFSVSPYDYVNHTWYDSTIVRLPGSIFPLGCAYNCSLYNLYINAYGTWGGQYMGIFDWHNLRVQSGRKLFDFGNESSEGYVNVVKWEYKNQFFDTVLTAMIHLNNYSHDIIMNNVTAQGGWVGYNIIQASSGIHDCTFSNFNFQLPFYNDTTSDAIHMIPDDTIAGTYQKNIFFENVTIMVGGMIDRYINFQGIDHVLPKQNGVMMYRNMTFMGTANNNKHSFFNNADSIYVYGYSPQLFDSVRTSGLTIIRNNRFNTISNDETLDFGSINAGATETQTMTVNGATAGDPVQLGIQPTAFTDGLIFTARCTANNTVSIQCYNSTAAPIDPASGVFTATVTPSHNSSP